MSLFKRKQKQSDSRDIYGCRAGYLTVQDADIDAFHLPLLDASDVMKRIEQRAQLIASKADQGEIDSANVDLAIWSFEQLLKELDAVCETWKAQCEVQIKQLAASLQDKTEAQELSLKAADDLSKRLKTS